jgi:ribosome maturation factor RimP
MELRELLEMTVGGLGYEVVDLEVSQHGKFFRVFIDKSGGITVDDCATVSNHLTRLFSAEMIDYDRLEVSSPGLDRPLKSQQDFNRFQGEVAKVRIRMPMNGQRRFQGTIKEATGTGFALEVDGNILNFDFENLDKARLVPNISGDL